MTEAIWNGAVIAASDDTVVVEGNHYFPPESVQKRYLQASAHSSHCGWKGDASYFHVVVDGKTNENAAWTYAAPYPGAAQISERIAFWHGVEVGG